MKSYLAAIAKKHTRETVTPVTTIKAKSVYEVADEMIARYPDLAKGIKDSQLFVDIAEE